MEGDATLNAQIGELKEVAELRWDGASELIQREVPARGTMKQCRMRTCTTEDYHKQIMSNL